MAGENEFEDLSAMSLEAQANAAAAGVGAGSGDQGAANAGQVGDQGQQGQQTQTAGAAAGGQGATDLGAVGQGQVADPNAAAAAQALTLRDYFRQLGYTRAAEAADDPAALDAMLEHNRLLEQQTQAYAMRLAQMQRQMETLQQQFGQQQIPGGQQQLAAQQAAAAQGPKGWNPPKWDPAMLAMLDFDAAGNPVPKPYADPTIAQTYLQFRDHSRNVLSQLALKPQEFLGQFGYMTQEQVDRRLEERLGQVLAQREAHSQLEAIRQQHGQWIYAHDARGNVVRDPVTNNPVLTAEGQVVDATFTELVNRGVPMQRALELAVAPLRATYQQQYIALQQGQGGQAAGGQQGAAATADRDRQFLRGANRIANRGGSNTAATARQVTAPPPNADFMDLARLDAEALGIPLN